MNKFKYKSNNRHISPMNTDKLLIKGDIIC